MAVYINTEALNSVSNSMNRINNNASQSLYELDNMINRLRCDWDGSASEKMSNSFWDIKNKYYEDREEEMGRYINFLNQVVATSYENVENKNIKAASEVKGNFASGQVTNGSLNISRIVSGVMPLKPKIILHTYNEKGE